MQKDKTLYPPRKYVVGRLSPYFSLSDRQHPPHRDRVADATSTRPFGPLMRAILSQRAKGKCQLPPERGAEKGRGGLLLKLQEDLPLYAPKGQAGFERLSLCIGRRACSDLSVTRLEFSLRFPLMAGVCATGGALGKQKQSLGCLSGPQGLRTKGGGRAKV